MNEDQSLLQIDNQESACRVKYNDERCAKRDRG